MRALYSSPSQTPIPCELLAHIVSCERCLDIVDRAGQRPTLKDREPLDVFGYSPREGAEPRPSSGGITHDRMMDVVQRKWKRVHDHRPGTLSIAVNGEVIASHAVRADHNRLTVRIEAIDRAKFIEVFSEQGRFDLPCCQWKAPWNPVTPQRLRVHLSDARVLELNVSVDGLGLERRRHLHGPGVIGAIRGRRPRNGQAGSEAAFDSSGGDSSGGSVYRPNRQWPWALALIVVVGLGSWIYSRHRAPVRASVVLGACN